MTNLIPPSLPFQYLSLPFSPFQVNDSYLLLPTSLSFALPQPSLFPSLPFLATEDEELNSHHFIIFFVSFIISVPRLLITFSFLSPLFSFLSSSAFPHFSFSLSPFVGILNDEVPPFLPFQYLTTSFPYFP